MNSMVPSSSGEVLEVGVAGSWVPLSYVAIAGLVYLLASDSRSRWCSFVLRNGYADIRQGGASIRGSAALVSDPRLREQITSMFVRKYGADRFAKWFPHAGRMICVALNEPLAERQGKRYFEWLESEFDAVSADYDRHITGNMINMFLRERSLSFMRSVFPDGCRLLEIGCGSGMETLPMLREGHEIVALDISSSMLEVVHRKAKLEGLEGRLTTIKMRAGDTAGLQSLRDTGLFGGCYSTYGALNCEPSLDGIPSALHSILQADGKFIAGIFNKYCLTEMIAYAATFRLRRAFRRLRNPILEGNSRFCVDVYSHSFAGFSQLFVPYFSIGNTIGVPVLLPPSDLERYARKFDRHPAAIRALEGRMSKTWPFRMLGDHFLVEMTRKSNLSA